MEDPIEMELPTELPTELAEDAPVIPTYIESVLPSIKVEEGFLKTLMATSISEEEDNDFPVSMVLMKGEKGELKEMSYRQSTYKQAAFSVASIMNANPDILAYWKRNIMNAILSEGLETDQASRAAESFLTGFMGEFLDESQL